jgi:predicted kinase
MVTRNAWVNVARKAVVPYLEIEVICSDIKEHRLRIARRQADIANHQLPTWQSVIHCQYAPWEREHCLIDTATLSIEQAVDTIISQLPP